MLRPAFVGRDHELARLGEALAHPPAVVLIEGEAGIGKTRLLHEFLASRAGQTLVAYCPPFRRPHTLGPIAGALRQVVDDVTGLPLSPLAGALRPVFPEWAAGLPPALEPAEDPTAARYRIFAALSELLRCLRITVVAVEDAHWADDATMEFLLMLAAEQKPGILVTFRPEDVPEHSLLPRMSRLAAGDTGMRVKLGPLDTMGTGGMIASMLAGASVCDRLAAFLHRQTEGVPLAVEEMVRLLADRADISEQNGTWVRRPLDEIVVPASISDAVAERSGRLTKNAQAILQAAAVLAEPSDAADLAAIAGVDADAAQHGLAEAIGCGLLESDRSARVSFRHVLACVAIYESMPGLARQSLHLRAGQLLERQSPPPVSRLARHFREAGQAERWHRYATEAVDLAHAASDDATAGRLLHELLTDPSVPASEVPRLTRKIPHDIAVVPEMAGLLRNILATKPLGRAQQAEVRYHLGGLLTLSDDPDGYAELERAVPHLTHVPADAAHAMFLLAAPRGPWPASVHRRWLRRAVRLPAPADPADRLRMLVDHASVLLNLGDNEGWAQAARIPWQTDNPRQWRQIVRGHLNIGDAALRWGRYSEAARHMTAGARVAEEHDYPHLHRRILTTAAQLDWFTGNWAGLAERVAALGDDADPTVSNTGLLLAGLLDVATGARDRAARRLSQTFSAFWRVGVLEVCADPAAALARLKLAEGNVAEALEVTAEPVDLVARKRIWIFGTDLVPARVAALLAADMPDDAAELTGDFGRGLRDRDAAAAKAGLALCRAMLARARGSLAAATTLYGRAAAAWEHLPRPYDALLARERQGHCMLAEPGREQAGLAVLRRTMGGLSRLGATADADRVARCLREHGVTVRRPGAGRPGNGTGLSPRELAVVRLLVTGMTDREIASSLFVTPKTIAFHLASARRKLNVSSRTALAAVAIERGMATATPA